jgi:hypothetical protein
MTANPSGKPLVAMIALHKGALPDMSAVVEELGRRYPDDEPPAEAVRGTESAVFRWGPGPIAVALKSEPIAWDELELPCQSAWWWEQATESLRKHSAHLLVSLAPSGEDPVDRHLRLSRVMAAILAHGQAAGVFWPAAGVVHPPEAFREQAAELSRDNLNPMLWIDMQIVPGDENTWSFYTTGLAAFGRPEIEIPSTQHAPSEIYELCGEVIAYLLASGEEIADGGVISRSDDEQIEVRYGPSMFDDESEVMQLGF